MIRAIPAFETPAIAKRAPLPLEEYGSSKQILRTENRFIDLSGLHIWVARHSSKKVRKPWTMLFAGKVLYWKFHVMHRSSRTAPLRNTSGSDECLVASTSL